MLIKITHQLWIFQTVQRRSSTCKNNQMRYCPVTGSAEVLVIFLHIELVYVRSPLLLSRFVILTRHFWSNKFHEVALRRPSTWQAGSPWIKEKKWLQRSLNVETFHSLTLTRYCIAEILGFRSPNDCILSCFEPKGSFALFPIRFYWFYQCPRLEELCRSRISLNGLR